MADFKNFNQDAYSELTRVERLKIKRTRKGRLFTFICLLALLGGLAYSSFIYADRVWIFLADKYFTNRINAVGSEMPEENRGKWLNIMLIGTDQRKDESSRSDTLMVAMINLEEKRIQVISIPRDTRVKIEGIEHKTKINHAHSYGGVELTKQTVEQFLGIPIHNYMETNFNGFENIIDKLGGVLIDVEKRMYYPAEQINLHKGEQRLDGHDSLAYVRFRSDGKGDLPRIERQHKFLAALAAEVLQPSTLLKLPQIAEELHNNVKTDLTVRDFIVLGSEFKNVKSESIRFTEVPGRADYLYGASFYLVDEEKLKVFIDEILNGGQTPEDVIEKTEEGVAQERDQTE